VGAQAGGDVWKLIPITYPESDQPPTLSLKPVKYEGVEKWILLQKFGE